MNNAGHAISVLAVDDSDAILEILRMTLEEDGHTVYTATNPHEGIAIYRKNSSKIQLVLLDYSMPEMNGDEVFKRLKNINADVRVCLVTSNAKSDVQSLLDDGILWYFQKPFQSEELTRFVRMAGQATPC